MKRITKILELILFLTLFFIYGCAHVSTRHIDKGDAYFEQKRYTAAADEYLSALKYERNNQVSQMKLCKVASPAYIESLKLAENYEKSSQFIKAKKAYKQTAEYIERFSHFGCIDFPIIDAIQKIAEMSNEILERHYQQAEAFFARRHYLKAIEEYKNASHKNAYKDSTTKIAESYYLQAQILESQSQFRNAATHYLFADNTIRNYKGARNKAVSLFYSLGSYFLSNKFCRRALTDLQEAIRIQPNFKDLPAKLNQAESCAIVKVAFSKFKNKTRRNIAGMSIGDFIYDRIQASLNNDASRFLRIVDTRGDYRNVDYKITGKLTQIRVIHHGLEKQRMSDIASRNYYCRRADEQGNVYNEICKEDFNIYYDEFTDSISIILSGSIKVVDTSTGENIVLYNISSQMDDSIRYADIVSNTRDVDLYQGLYALVNERRHLIDDEELVVQAISEIETGFVKEIIARTDNTRDISDPITLVIY